MTFNNVRISGVNPGDPREESDIRYNYNNLKQIICASTKLGGNQPMHHSSDGGVTWLTGFLGSRPGDVRQGDPSIDWTSDGTAWTVTIGISAALQLILRTFSSPDAGVTWNFDSTVTSTQTAMDKEALWIDHSPSSPFRDSMYLIWHNGGPCFVSVRQGTTGTWSVPLQISGGETTGTAIGSDIKSNADGEVFAFWPDTGSQNLYVAKSVDGGATFLPPVTIATTFGSFQIGVPAQDNRRCLIYLSGAAYRTALQNHVYAVWMDLAGGAACNTAGSEPDNDVTSTCKTRIWFARSTDGGVTWDNRLQLHGAPSLNDQIFPRLALDETTGVLMVVYYDTINDSGRLQAELWMQTSYDFGDSWTAPVQVATAQTNETVPGAELDFQYGDYIGLTGHAGSFFACWTDRRGGGAEEIWGALMPASTLVTAIPNSGKFSHVCAGSFADELLTIVNNGPNLLSISNIVSSSSDFAAPGVLSYPLNVAAGGSVDVVIRFAPTTIGPKTATISIFSSDPASPHAISVSGLCPAPHLALAIADTGRFGHVCVGSFRDEPLILNNSGLCRLLVTAISSSSAEFHAPLVMSFPLAINPGTSLELPIRFEPSTIGPKAATLKVLSDDPTGPHTIAVSGDAPSGKLAITGSLCFGGVSACCNAERTISICNVGECGLHVASVAFRRKRHHWKLINNPFPATLQPGSCLNLVIRYTATERCPRSCELEIKSDDPNMPVKVLDLLAYTIWEECHQKKCCDKCDKNPCCCKPCPDDCCDEDEDEGGDEG
jgi:hypothetical protein